MRKLNIAKVLIIAIMIFAKETLTAQWTGTNPIITSSSVGIGSTTPNADLEIDRNGTIQSFSNNHLRLKYQGFFSNFGTSTFYNYSWDFSTDGSNVGSSSFLAYNSMLNFKYYFNGVHTSTPLSLTQNSAIASNLNINNDLNVSNNFKIYTTTIFGVTDRIASLNIPLISTKSISGSGIFASGNSLFSGDVSVNNNTYLWGKVRIGSKTATFHPDAKLSVEGKVAAQYFVITKPSNWSDKVFQKGYNLRTLKEIEQFINQNKHLPDVPSEAEVMEKGYDANEMDAILLQKIEELTLFSIEQNKKIAELQKQIIELKKK